MNSQKPLLFKKWKKSWFWHLKFPTSKKKGKWRGEQMAAVAEMAARAAKATGSYGFQSLKKGWLQWKITNLNKVCAKVTCFEKII